mmetsp:Transcript_64176/g.128856  ORF Transcript_64176/g.128856 Transcript_64176/m.128856 type:complete len:227 (+) Transcript_64176:412-1092(+)
MDSRSSAALPRPSARAAPLEASFCSCACKASACACSTSRCCCAAARSSCSRPRSLRRANAVSCAVTLALSESTRKLVTSTSRRESCSVSCSTAPASLPARRPSRRASSAARRPGSRAVAAPASSGAGPASWQERRRPLMLSSIFPIHSESFETSSGPLCTRLHNLCKPFTSESSLATHSESRVTASRMSLSSFSTHSEIRVRATPSSPSACCPPAAFSSAVAAFMH